MDHPFPDSITPLFQIMVIILRTESRKGLQRADEDLLTTLNPTVKGSLLKTEAMLLPFVLFCFL